MKKLIITAGVLIIGLVASSCERQVIAQNGLPVAATPLPVEPTPNQLPPTPSPAEPTGNQLFPAPSDPGPVGAVPTLPPAANPKADIGELGARQKGLEIAAKQHGQPNPTIIRAAAMTYKEAVRTLPKEAQGTPPDREANIPVRVVEMEGVFKAPRHSGPPGVPEDTRSATKLYLILRAADGLLLETTLEYPEPLQGS
ncbi:MAG: hypothetical protein KME08_06920 [Aphanothece sp. CMT-3BRIN-NPC111]|nr:hypothetical protein [Aphanothece sp. CMT-3BRIN-NPC111]